MSIARLIITAIHVEHISQSEAARRYGVSQSWVSRLLARYRLEGDVAFDPKPRRPHQSPTALSDDTIARIIELRNELTKQGHAAAAHTISWHLETHHNTTVHPSTIWCYLKKHDLVTPQPQKKPRSPIRFQEEQPNETWQSDFTHHRLADGSDTEIITWLDDHWRFALHVSAHHRITGKIVLNTFKTASQQRGKPASTLTDNGMVFTTKLSAGRNGLNSRNALEKHLAEHGIHQKLHPRTPHNLRKGRTIPTNPQELVTPPTTNTQRQRTPKPHRPIR